jgi:hypothetical protein
MASDRANDPNRRPRLDLPTVPIDRSREENDDSGINKILNDHQDKLWNHGGLVKRFSLEKTPYGLKESTIRKNKNTAPRGDLPKHLINRDED